MSYVADIFPQQTQSLDPNRKRKTSLSKRKRDRQSKSAYPLNQGKLHGPTLTA